LKLIKLKGSHFFYANGTQFSVRAVEWSFDMTRTVQGLAVTDLLADVYTCRRDVPYFKQLGINTILVDQLSLGVDRSQCLQLLSDAGIYVLLKLNELRKSDSSGRFTAVRDYTILDWMRALVDEFHSTSNLLGFYLLLNSGAADELPLWKGWMKTVKEDYIKANGYRDIPVGAIHSHRVRPSSVSLDC
jgi:hypothetical protein